MKPPLPPPPVPGNTEWERFDNAVGKFLSVPKEAYLKEEAKLKRRRETKRAAKKHGLTVPRPDMSRRFPL